MKHYKIIPSSGWHNMMNPNSCDRYLFKLNNPGINFSTLPVPIMNE